MPKEDYLLKYLEKLSRVIAAMLGFREKGIPENAVRLADETFQELLNINLEELKNMSTEKFMEIIRGKAYSTAYIEVLARLSHETANSLEANEKTESAFRFYQKTLELFYLLNEKDKTYSFEREMTISELKEKINYSSPLS